MPKGTPLDMNDEEKRVYISQRKKAWYEANKERILAKQKIKRQAEPEKYKAIAKKHYEKNHETIIAKSREYYKANPEQCKERAKKHYRENLEAHKANQRAWAAANKDKVNAGSRKYRKSHPEVRRVALNRYRARKLNQSIPYNALQMQARFEYWGNKCWMCGTEDNLTMDHVKPISKGGLDTPSNIRPACKSCNSSKNNKWPYPLKTWADGYTVLYYS
jgi:5-methylcytosine-specific restriction endonuclease McrA